jgi:hypothetical protein
VHDRLRISSGQGHSHSGGRARTHTCLPGRRSRTPGLGFASLVSLTLLFGLPVSGRDASVTQAAPLTPAASGPLAAASRTLSPADSAEIERLEGALDRLPIYFVANRGQSDPRVAYYVPGGDTTVYFTEEGITYALAGQGRRWAVKLDFVGAETREPVGEHETPAVVSYFRGDPADWKTGIPTFGAIRYRDLWPGIDLVYTGEGGRLKYTFVVRPGADPTRIRLAYRGTSGVRLMPEGRLSVSTPLRSFEEDAPYAYQPQGERRVEVEAAFAAEASDSPGTAFGFRVGRYDPDRPLILDPVVHLSYSGFVGGSGSEIARGIAVDAAGNAYITGQTTSDEASFPVLAGPDLTFNDTVNYDAFVAKINADGASLVYAGYIGGAGSDVGHGIAVDSAGYAYVVGETASDQATFPETAGPDLTHNGGTDVFVAKVHFRGTSLLYCGYIGGTGNDIGQGIAVDASGNAYVAGETTSTEATFPVAGGPQVTYQGGAYDAFVAKVNAAGTGLSWAGYIGGAGQDSGFAVAVDASGSAYVTGRTGSDQATFPVAVGPDLTWAGSLDGFVAKVDPTGASLVYAGYIGGTGWDEGHAIAVDASGSAYVAGLAGSPGTGFPATVGPQLAYGGGAYDGFVAKVDPAGSAFVYAGFIGGSQDDQARGVAVDGVGNAYVTGYTLSADFPVSIGPDLSANGNSDAFVSKVNAAGSGFVYGTYIGGTLADDGYAIAVDGAGDAYVAGVAGSDQSSFPVVAGPSLVKDGFTDAFVAKVVDEPRVVKMIGFETMDATEIVSYGTGATWDSITVRPGSGLVSLRQLTNPTILASGLAPLDSLGLRFSFYKPGNPVGNQTLVLFKSGTTDLWSLQLRPDGRLHVQAIEPLALVGAVDGSTTLADTTWSTVRLVYDRAAGGLLKVWLDTSLEIDITHTAAGTAVDRVDVLGGVSAYNFDDFYLTDTADQPPLGQIVRIGPDGAGSQSGFDTPVPSSARELNVDEVTPSDTDYNQHVSNTPATDLYSLGASPAGAINAVKGMWRMRQGSGGSGSGTHDVAWRVGGAEDSLAVSLTTSFAPQELVWEAPPTIGGDWTQARVDGLELGAKHNGTLGGDTYVSWTTAMVDYDASGASGGGAACTAPWAPWMDASWPYRKQITIDHDMVVGDLADFPVLVTTNADADLIAHAQASGADLVFTDEDGVTRLSHQIESYGAGTLVAWVKVPVLPSGTDKTLYLYYGNLSAPDQQDVFNTWTNGYEGVWHFNQASGSGPYLTNSALADHDGTPVNTLFNATGKMAGARTFVDGATHEIYFANDGALLDGWSQWALEYWIYPDYATDADWEASGEDLFFNATGPVRLGRVRRYTWNTAGRGEVQMDIQFATAGTFYIYDEIDRQSWNHIVFSYQGSDFRIFFNGTEIGRFLTPNDSLIANTMLNLGDPSGALNGSLDEVRISTVGRSEAWILTEYANQNAPATFCEVCGEQALSTTAVRLQSFEAVALDSAVELTWRTASELDNLGFHLHRSFSESGPWERLTASLIPGLGSSPIGASYSWRDTGLSNGTRYFYRLEDVDTSSVSTFHGPVSAVPEAGVAGGGGGEGDAGGEGDDPSVLPPCSPSTGYPCMESYGDPSSVSVRVLSRTPRHAEVELFTGGFYAVRDASGQVRVWVPGFEDPEDPHAAALPLKRVVLDGEVGRKERVGLVRAREWESFPGLVPQAVGYPEMEVHSDGTIRAGRRAAVRRAGGGEAEELARLGGVSFQGEAKRVSLELLPLQLDSSTGGVRLAKRLWARVDFFGREAKETGQGRWGRRAPRRGLAGSGTLAVLHTQRRGLYAVPFETLFPGQRRGVLLDTLGLLRQGEAVPFHVEPERGVFGPGSVLFFYADREAASTAFSGEVAYELVRAAEGAQMDVVGAPPLGEPLREPSVAVVGFEENRYYQPGLLEAEDVWQWEAVFGGAAKAKPFVLNGVDPASTRPGRLEVFLQGASDAEGVEDHHVEVLLNGTWVGETWFDGKRAKRFAAEVASSVLREGDNELVVRNVGDTGVYSVVFLDRFTVAYPQRSGLRGGVFEGEWSETGVPEVGLEGAGSTVVAVDVTEAQRPVWLTGVESGPATVRWGAARGRRYLVASAEGLLSPRVSPPVQSTLLSATNQADYILIAPQAFLPAAEPLLVRRQSQGLRARAVSLEEVAGVFGHGEASGEAIRNFLTYAYHSWQRPSVRYVVLLGDGSYDPRNFTGVSAPAPLPALFVKTSYLLTASDPALAAVNGEDEVPDLAVGRLPAQTVEEAEGLVGKLLAWEDSGQGLRGQAVLVADNPDKAGDFEANVQDIAESYFGQRSPKLLLLRQLGSGLRDAIRDAFDEGASYVSYVGHGATAVWASENVWNSWDVASLQAQSEQPVMVTMNCLNGYFVAADFDSLSEAYVKAQGRGTIAAFSPSGLSLDSPAHVLHRALTEELVRGGHERLGDAVVAAQAVYAKTGLMPELLSVYQLLGDPGMEIR